MKSADVAAQMRRCRSGRRRWGGGDGAAQMRQRRYGGADGATQMGRRRWGGADRVAQIEGAEMATAQMRRRRWGGRDGGGADICSPDAKA